MDDNSQSTAISNSPSLSIGKRLLFDAAELQVLATVPLSVDALAGIQLAQFEACERAPLSLLLEVDRAWLELWQEQFAGVPFTLTAFARSQAAQP